MEKRFEQWLTALSQQGASDLYLVAGAPPSIRIHGAVRPLAEPPLTGDEIEESVLAVLPPHAVESYRSRGYSDAALRRGVKGRFRVNLHRERGRAAASIGSLPTTPPRLAEKRGLLAPDEARARAPHGDELEGLLRIPV